eukprot:COSAG06_NODE_4776_length_3961_cov_55.473071_6_plen_171_part_00
MGMGADHVPLQQQSATWATLTAAARSDEAPSCCSIVTRRQKCKVPRASANCSTIRAPPRCQSSSLRSDRRLQQIVYMEKMKLGFDNLVAVAAAAPAELVVGGVLEGRGGSAELVCARTRLLALSLELELAQLDAGGGGRRISACFRSFATRWRRRRARVKGAPCDIHTCC